jgi:hypothetical protein
VQRLSPDAAALFVKSMAMLGLVLTPLAVLAGVLGAWRLGADAGWTSDFFITDGLLSRYQSWFAAAIGVQSSALILNRWIANQNSNVPVLRRGLKAR